jgi:high-affinity iron transporter
MPILSVGMRLRTILKLIAALALGAVAVAHRPAGLDAQEHPARRLSSIVGVAVAEYALGIDAGGRLISDVEYQEAVDFLNDAREVARRLSGDDAARARVLLDSLVAAVGARRPSPEVQQLHERFVAALGHEGALELPGRPLDLASGRAIYQRSCATCHGATGMGDGPAAKGMDPPPPPVGDAAAMRDVSPALMYRVVSVGIPGTAMKGWSSDLSVEERWDVIAYLSAMRASDAERLEGEGLFLQRCAACHGTLGGADGPASPALTRLPPEVGAFAWQVERSDAQIAEAIRAGIPGSAMPPSRDLSDAELAKAVAFVRSIPARTGEVPAAAMASADGDPSNVARRVLGIVDRSLAAAQAGRTSDAGDLAFDAYVAFEPLEAEARAKSPGLVATMESHFAALKAAVKGSDLRAAKRARDAIEAGLPGIVSLTSTPSGGWAAFLQSLLIILREGLEAILVVGAVATFLIRTGNRHRLRAIWIGCGLAVVASAVTAVILQTVLRALPATREIIEGVTMLVAVAVLFSVSYWLISKVEAAKWQQFIREKVQAALAHGGERALAVVAFLAVYREGAETALFYQALFNEGSAVMTPILLGILLGGAILAAVWVAIHRFGARIPLRPFFAVTSVLLYYMAFVFMGKGIRELQEGNVVSITLLPGLPEVPAMGIFATVETLLAQLLLVVLFVLALAKTFWPKRSVALPTVAVTAPAPAPVAAAPAATPELAYRLEELRLRVEALERMASEMGSPAGRNGVEV